MSLIYRKEFDAIACEMEGRQLRALLLNMKFLAVLFARCPDKADGAAHDTYENFGDTAADNSASIVLAMLQSM